MLSQGNAETITEQNVFKKQLTSWFGLLDISVYKQLSTLLKLNCHFDKPIVFYWFRGGSGLGGSKINKCIINALVELTFM